MEVFILHLHWLNNNIVYHWECAISWYPINTVLQSFFFFKFEVNLHCCLAFKWLFMVNAQEHKLFLTSFMGHAVTARRIVSFFIVQKKARNIRLSICLLFMIYRLMSQISVWPSRKMTKHCLFLVINALHYCKKNSKLFHPVLCTWPFHPSLLPMDVLWAVSSKLRRILDISSSLLCAAFTVPPLLCESKISKGGTEHFE